MTMTITVKTIATTMTMVIRIINYETIAIRTITITMNTTTITTAMTVKNNDQYQ